jgi:hypothetical protein
VRNAAMGISAGPMEAIQFRFRVPSLPLLASTAAVGWFSINPRKHKQSRVEQEYSRFAAAAKPLRP